MKTEKEIEKLAEVFIDSIDLELKELHLPVQKRSEYLKKKDAFIAGYKAALQNNGVSDNQVNFLPVLEENYQAQIAGYYNFDKTDEEKKIRNAVIEEYKDLIAIYKSKIKQKVSDISSDKFYKLFKDELLVKCDRLLRDKGMSSAESNGCIGQAFDDTMEEYAAIVNERKDSAGVWVKTSERLPNKAGAHWCKLNDGLNSKNGAYFNGNEWETYKGQFILEWLDESQPRVY